MALLQCQNAPMPQVAAELASALPSADKPQFALWSTLAAEHRWRFSGLSGGPILVASARIATSSFEGARGSRQLRQKPEAIVGANEFVLTGH
jgi:hypothetical protein